MEPDGLSVRYSMTRRSMLRRSAVGVAGITLGGTLLAACGDDETTATTEGGTTSITEYNSFGGDTFLNAMTYIAIDQGFYEEEGLDYKIEYPDGTVRVIQTIVGGKTGVGWSDPFGQLIAVSGGFPVKSLYQSFVGSPFGEYVIEGSSITEFTADQVRGTKIGITAPDGGEVPQLRGSLSELGLTDDDYELVTTGDGPPEIADALESGRIDIMSMSVLDAENAKTVGVPTVEVTPAYILEFPGSSYFTTPEMAESQPETFQKFFRARSKAFVWLRANPTGAAEIAIKAAPASAEGLSTEDVAALLEAFWVGQNEIYFDESNEAFQQLGLQNAQSWSDYQDFLIEGSVSADGEGLTDPVSIDDIVDNSMIEFANDFDYAEVEDLAKQFKAG